MALCLDELAFEVNHLRINTSRIDKFIDLANSEFDEPARSFKEEMLAGSFNNGALIQANKAGSVLFTIYCLGVTYCYAMLENNRAEIIARRISNIPQNGKKSLYKIDAVKKILKQKFNLEHESIMQFALAEEFRLVTNAIKHDSFSFSTEVITKENVTYKVEQLRDLYERRDQLTEYLSDLDSKIS
jgi:hypothetical protein